MGNFSLPRKVSEPGSLLSKLEGSLTPKSLNLGSQSDTERTSSEDELEFDRTLVLLLFFCSEVFSEPWTLDLLWSNWVEGCDLKMPRLSSSRACYTIASSTSTSSMVVATNWFSKSSSPCLPVFDSSEDFFLLVLIVSRIKESESRERDGLSLSSSALARSERGPWS